MLCPLKIFFFGIEIASQSVSWSVSWFAGWLGNHLVGQLVGWWALESSRHFLTGGSPTVLSENQPSKRQMTHTRWCSSSSLSTQLVGPTLSLPVPGLVSADRACSVNTERGQSVATAAAISLNQHMTNGSDFSVLSCLPCFCCQGFVVDRNAHTTVGMPTTAPTISLHQPVIWFPLFFLRPPFDMACLIPVSFFPACGATFHFPCFHPMH